MAAIYRFTFHFQNTEMTKMLSFISWILSQGY
jgi:hypothetical protein